MNQFAGGVFLILSIINNKGGVGKTTITVNLAHAIANKGKSVLVVDSDPQSNTSSIFTPNPDLLNPNSLYNLFDNNLPIEECIYKTGYDGLDILPNVHETSQLEIDLYKDVNMSYCMLRDSLRDYADANYDITIIDCSPTLGLFTIQALISSDVVIVPIEAGCRYSLNGFVAALDVITAITEKVNHKLRFLKAVINKADSRTTLSRISVERIRKQFIDKTFETTFNNDIKIKEAAALGITVIRHNPSCGASKKFRLLADEVISLTENVNV